jgi:hypothetical protein
MAGQYKRTPVQCVRVSTPGGHHLIFHTGPVHACVRVCTPGGHHLTSHTGKQLRACVCLHSWHTTPHRQRASNSSVRASAPGIPPHRQRASNKHSHPTQQHSSRPLATASGREAAHNTAIVLSVLPHPCSNTNRSTMWILACRAMGDLTGLTSTSTTKKQTGFKGDQSPNLQTGKNTQAWRGLIEKAVKMSRI